MAASAGLREIAHEDLGAWVGFREDRVSRMAIGAAGGLSDPLSAGLTVHAPLILLNLVKMTARARLSRQPAGPLLMRDALDVTMTDGAREISVHRAFERCAVESLGVTIPTLCGLSRDGWGRSQHEQYPNERDRAHKLPNSVVAERRNLRYDTDRGKR